MAKRQRNYAAENAARNARARAKGFSSYSAERRARAAFKVPRGQQLSAAKAAELKRYRSEAVRHAKSSRAFNPQQSDLDNPMTLELFHAMINDPHSDQALAYWLGFYGYENIDDWEEFRERYEETN